MLTITGLLADATGEGWGHMDGWGTGWMWVWAIVMMLLFAVFVAWLIRTGGNPSAPSKDPTHKAREILAERYAKGEISTQEYRERVGKL